MTAGATVFIDAAAAVVPAVSPGENWRMSSGAPLGKADGKRGAVARGCGTITSPAPSPATACPVACIAAGAMVLNAARAAAGLGNTPVAERSAKAMNGAVVGNPALANNPKASAR